MISFKDIPILVMKLVRFSTKTMCKCLHMYPLLFGTLLLFFLMHLFFPFAFVSLVFSVPFLLAAFIVYTRFRFPKLPDGHRDLPPVKCEAKTTPRLKKPYISPQMSRRRNFRAKIDDPIPNEHRPMIEVSSPMKHFLSPDETSDQGENDNLIWRNEKIIEESLNEFKNKETTAKNKESNSQMSNDDDDEEVKTQSTTGIRIVGWNENDQKNLMDLGLSEMERNQRLENLIARRRARKFLMAIRGQAGLLYENELESVQKMASVKTDNIPSNDDPVPGSAPSVLLPARNPFDIPYDPTEEKPNLTVDEFQQEFLGPHQISRHESFTLGTSSFEVNDDQDSMRPAHQLYIDRVVKRESRFARLRRQPVQGDHDTLIEKLQNQQDDPDEEDESCSSTNKEEQEAAELSGQHKDTENTSDEELQARSQEASSDAVQNQRQQQLEQEQEISSSLDPVLSTTTNNNVCPNSSSNTMYGSRDSYIDYLNNKVAYNLTHSTASDMQVEVSEPGSPSCNITTPLDFQSSDGEQEMEKASINFESQEEPPPLNNTMQQVEENEDKQQEQDVIEIGPSSSAIGGEDKSSVSVGNVEEDDDEEVSGGGVLAPQSHSNEECNNDEEVGRDRRQRSSESLDQVVEIPGEDEEEESIFFVDNSNSMPPLSPEQAAGDSRPTLQGNPEEIENQQPDPVEDEETDSRNMQVDEFRNQTGQDIISDTRKYDDEEYINPFANSVEEVDVNETNNLIGSTMSSDEKFGREGDYDAPIQQLNSEASVEKDIKQESPVEQLKLDTLESRGGESQHSSEESREETRATPVDGVSHAPTDEEVNTKPVEGSRGEESQAPLEEEEEAKSELVEESQGESQAAKSGLV